MPDDIVRPGPVAIEPGTCPGGITLHVYAAPTGRFLLATSASTVMEAAYRAGTDADEAFAALFTFEHGVCLVAYDGDTGERLPLGEIIGHTPGVPYGPS